MNGKIAKWLRILGHDTFYVSSAVEDSSILDSLRDRVLVTRDRDLAIRAMKYGKSCIFVPEDLEDALSIISLKFGVRLKIDLSTTRCPFCNERLVRASREEVRSKIPRETLLSHRKFLVCPLCGKIFWFGTHYWEMLKTLSRVKKKKYERMEYWPMMRGDGNDL